MKRKEIEKFREDGLPVFYPDSLNSWRDWLASHHADTQAVWLILFHKKSGIPTISWSESVDEALCFGWIDSVANKRDHQSSYRYFSPRKPRSNWSRINKEKVSRLRKEGRFTPAGEAMVREAKSRGTWDALNEVEDLIVPSDFQAELDKYPNAGRNYEAFPPTARKIILYWIFSAKRPETRKKRIAEAASLAEKNLRANQNQVKK